VRQRRHQEALHRVFRAGVDRVVRAGTRTLRRAGGEFIEQCA
jgi:hypothetical protein